MIDMIALTHKGPDSISANLEDNWTREPLLDLAKVLFNRPRVLEKIMSSAGSESANTMFMTQDSTA